MNGAHIFILPAVGLFDSWQWRHPIDWGIRLRRHNWNRWL